MRRGNGLTGTGMKQVHENKKYVYVGNAKRKSFIWAGFLPLLFGSFGFFYHGFTTFLLVLIGTIFVKVYIIGVSMMNVGMDAFDSGIYILRFAQVFLSLFLAESHNRRHFPNK